MLKSGSCCELWWGVGCGLYTVGCRLFDAWYLVGHIHEEKIPFINVFISDTDRSQLLFRFPLWFAVKPYQVGAGLVYIQPLFLPGEMTNTGIPYHIITVSVFRCRYGTDTVLSPFSNGIGVPIPISRSRTYTQLAFYLQL